MLFHSPAFQQASSQGRLNLRFCFLKSEKCSNSRKSRYASPPPGTTIRAKLSCSSLYIVFEQRERFALPARWCLMLSRTLSTVADHLLNLSICLIDPMGVLLKIYVATVTHTMSQHAIEHSRGIMDIRMCARQILTNRYCPFVCIHYLVVGFFADSSCSFHAAAVITVRQAWAVRMF